MGERVNGIHEVRGSIPLASIGAAGAVLTDRPKSAVGRLAQLVRAPR